MVANKPKNLFSVSLTLCDFVLALNALVRKSSDLLKFHQTHKTAVFSP